MLNIEQQIVISERNNTLQEMIGNEPDNSLYKYFLEGNNIASDQKAQIVYSNYDSLTWGEVAKHLTSQKVRRIGIKTFPQVGAIGFFTLLNEERSKILAPVHYKAKKYVAPTFTIEESDTSLIFHCSSPKDVAYICYRIILRLNKFAHEYITYEETLEVPKPVTTGTYDIYCVGYIHEGEAVSEDSEHYSVDIIGTQEDWPGPMEGSDLFITDVEITKDNKVNIRRSDGFTKDSDNIIPVPISATFLADGKLAITLSNGNIIVTDNTGGGGGGSGTLVNLSIPKLTSTTSDILISGYYDSGSYPAYKAFDKAISRSSRAITNSLTNCWLGYKMPHTMFLDEAIITTGTSEGAMSSGKGNCPKSILIQGSNDGADWIDLTDTITIPCYTYERSVKPTKNVEMYQYYRLYVIDSYNTESGYNTCGIIELDFKGHYIQPN